MEILFVINLIAGLYQYLKHKEDGYWTINILLALIILGHI